jgi:hypothetical protein
MLHAMLLLSCKHELLIFVRNCCAAGLKMTGTRRGRVVLPQYVVIRSSWYLALLLVALMAGVKLSHQVPTTTDVGVSDNVPQDDFAAWLQEMTETSDSDDDETTPGAADTGSDDIPNLSAGGGGKRGKDDDKKDKHHSSSSSSSGKGSSNSKASPPKENYDSIGVKPPPTGTPKKITVGKNGKGDFKTINEALNSIKPGATYRTIIKIKAGVYE